MDFARMLRRMSAPAGVLVVMAGVTGSAAAADTPAPPAPAAAAPPAYAYQPAALPPHPNCPTCNAAPAPAPCGDCGTSYGHGGKGGWLGFGMFEKKAKPMRVPALCPGACFGYFQTQWTPWCEACPIPYAGHGATDAPPPKTPPSQPVTAGGGVPLRPGEQPKMPAPPATQPVPPMGAAEPAPAPPAVPVPPGPGKFVP